MNSSLVKLGIQKVFLYELIFYKIRQTCHNHGNRSNLKKDKQIVLEQLNFAITYLGHSRSMSKENNDFRTIRKSKQSKQKFATPSCLMNTFSMNQTKSWNISMERTFSFKYSKALRAFSAGTADRHKNLWNSKLTSSSSYENPSIFFAFKRIASTN